MDTRTLHYIYDPLCGWCYAAAPLVAAVRSSGIGLILHGGGLWGSPTPLGPAKAAYIRASDGRIAELTGQAFGAPYLDGLLRDPATVFWSRPTIAAVLAAAKVKPFGDVEMLHAIQEEHYVHGRRVVNLAELTGIAAEIGLDAAAFQASVAQVDLDGHIAATRALMGDAGIGGFPGFLLQIGDELRRVAHEPFYGRPQAFVAALDHDR